MARHMAILVRSKGSAAKDITYLDVIKNDQVEAGDSVWIRIGEEKGMLRWRP